MAVKRMDNFGIVVEALDAAVALFTELGLVLEGRMPIEGEWAGRVTGVHDQRVAALLLMRGDRPTPMTKNSLMPHIDNLTRVQPAGAQPSY